MRFASPFPLTLESETRGRLPMHQSRPGGHYRGAA